MSRQPSAWFAHAEIQRSCDIRPVADDADALIEVGPSLEPRAVQAQILPERAGDGVELRAHESGVLETLLGGISGCATAASVVPLTFEIYLEHYKGSFGNKWEWVPIACAPPVLAAGVAGVFSERAARTALPLTSTIYALNGVIVSVLHGRGVVRRPGALREAKFNLVMGPPLLAPGSLVLVATPRPPSPSEVSLAT